MPHDDAMASPAFRAANTLAALLPMPTSRNIPSAPSPPLYIGSRTERTRSSPGKIC